MGAAVHDCGVKLRRDYSPIFVPFIVLFYNLVYTVKPGGGNVSPHQDKHPADLCDRRRYKEQRDTHKGCPACQTCSLECELFYFSRVPMSYILSASGALCPPQRTRSGQHDDSNCLDEPSSQKHRHDNEVAMVLNIYPSCFFTNTPQSHNKLHFPLTQSHAITSTALHICSV